MSNHNKLTKENLLALYNDSKSYISDSESHKKAIEFINNNDFPNSKTEDWKNTDIKKITKHNFTIYNNQSYKDKINDTFYIYDLNAIQIVFVNGRFSPINSNIEEINNSNIFVGSIKEGKEKHPNIFKKYYNTTDITNANIFSALNTAYAEDGAFIYLPKNTELEKTVHILYYSDGADTKGLIQNRNLVVAEENTKLEILTSYHALSYDTVLNNTVTEIFLEENSNAKMNIFQGEGEGAFQLNNLHISQQKGSTFESNTATLCGELVRNDLVVNLNGEYCQTNLNGFYLAEKEHIFDNFIKVNHLSANCQSNQLYKGTIDNNAIVSFFSKVYVAPDSQKTDANQSNKNILLSDYAKVYSMPQLEIYADDVSCAHGSTTGQLDKEALFYLRTRGISERIAKTLMLYAFISDVIVKIENKAYKDFLFFLINRRLKQEKIEGLCSHKICPSC